MVKSVIDGTVFDESDGADAAMLDAPVCVAPTLMRIAEDRIRLARTCAEFAVQIKARRSQTGGGAC
jgi:hypothetical protein